MLNKVDSLARPLYWLPVFYSQYNHQFVQSKGEVTNAWWYCNGSNLFSGFHSPFGGFHANLSSSIQISADEVRKNLLNLRENISFRKKNLSLKIRTYPEDVFSWWNPGQVLALSQLGFRELYRETVHYIPINGEYEYHWNRNRIREFRKTKEILSVHDAVSRNDKLSVFAILNSDAASKGRKFPISEEHFSTMCEIFDSHNMNLFICLDKTTKLVVASAICQIIDSKSVYVYRWGVLPARNNNNSSPITVLAHHIYNYYQGLGKDVLYLGSSSVNGTENTGLISFKESLGAQQSYSLIFDFDFGETFM